MFKAGQIVRILQGQYTGWEGIVLERPAGFAENVVLVEFRVGHRMFEVELPADHVRATGGSDDTE
jgi:transcription antitermination factor NusG